MFLYGGFYKLGFLGCSLSLLNIRQKEGSIHILPNFGSLPPRVNKSDLYDCGANIKASGLLRGPEADFSPGGF
jgi:hypothetical protein